MAPGRQCPLAVISSPLEQNFITIIDEHRGSARSDPVRHFRQRIPGMVNHALKRDGRRSIHGVLISYSIGNGNCNHAGLELTVIDVTHLTHWNQRRFGVTSLKGAPWR